MQTQAQVEVRPESQPRVAVKTGRKAIRSGLWCAVPPDEQREFALMGECRTLRRAYEALPIIGGQTNLRRAGADRLFAQSGLTVTAFAHAVGWRSEQ